MLTLALSVISLVMACVAIPVTVTSVLTSTSASVSVLGVFPVGVAWLLLSVLVCDFFEGLPIMLLNRSMIPAAYRAHVFSFAVMGAIFTAVPFPTVLILRIPTCHAF